MMRKSFHIFILLGISALSVHSQAPEAFNYQAIVRDAAGNYLANRSVGIQISILQGMIDGPSVYTETHDPVTNGFGIINLAIGTGATSDDFSAIDWSMGPYYIKVEVDIYGGSNYSLMGTSQLLSVPYALHAQTAEDLTPQTYSVGDMALGGIVFYVNSSGTHGLVAAKVDQYEKTETDGLNWYDIQNVLNDPANHDAQGGEYFDWRLPTLWELNLMYENLHLNEDGGFQDDWYWSATQALGSDVLEGIDPAVVGLDFMNGDEDNEEPDNTTRFYARAIRVF